MTRTTDNENKKSLRSPKRRKLIAGVASGLSAAVLAETASTEDGPRALAPDDSTKLQGHPPSDVGERSPFETPRRLVSKEDPQTSSRTPLQDLTGMVTPSDLHFERHHGGVPRIDPERYTLLVHGLVGTPTIFTLDELKRFPSVSRFHFLECSGNGGEALSNPKAELTPQDIDGLTSTSEWTGVPLSLLFREVGALGEARWFLAEGADAAVMTRSIPMGKAWDDAMLVYTTLDRHSLPQIEMPARDRSVYDDRIAGGTR